MSTYTSEPGTRLAGRYRLEDQVDAGGGWALWKAIDEILARAVTVVTFADGFPRVLRAGNVICFEPRFIVGDQALFVEDTILITRDGHEILNPPLPYSAKDIEAAIAKKPDSR